MIRSMTGFAGKTAMLSLSNNEKGTFAISIKSLNSRFFEVTCKLHYQISNLETELIQLLKKKLHRGHVYLTIHIDNQALFKGTIEPSHKIIDGYVKAIEEIKNKFNIGGNLSIDDLLLLPNVFIVEEKEIDDSTKRFIIDQVTHLIEDVIKSQEKEGLALKKDIEQRISVMQKEIDEIEAASKVLMQQQKEKVQATLKEVMNDESKFAEIQKNAAYALLDKMDIHEEIIRFKSHIKNLINQIESTEIELGKKLDFILQELAREINTIAAKCSDATIGKLAINVKVELEKAREQAQNIV